MLPPNGVSYHKERQIHIEYIAASFLSLSLQLQWLLATGRSRSSTLQIRVAQAHGAERRQALQALHRTITTDIEGHTGCQPALDIVYTLT